MLLSILFAFLILLGAAPPDGELELHVARNWDTIATSAGLTATVITILSIIKPTPLGQRLAASGYLPLVAAAIGAGLAVGASLGTAPDPEAAWLPAIVTGLLAGAAAVGVHQAVTQPNKQGGGAA